MSRGLHGFRCIGGDFASAREDPIARDYAFAREDAFARDYAFVL